MWLAEVDLEAETVTWIGKQDWHTIKYRWEMVWVMENVWCKIGPYEDPGPEFHAEIPSVR